MGLKPRAPKMRKFLIIKKGEAKKIRGLTYEKARGMLTWRLTLRGFSDPPVNDDEVGFVVNDDGSLSPLQE